MAGNWQSLPELLDDYNRYMENELDRRRFIEWLMDPEATWGEPREGF